MTSVTEMHSMVDSVLAFGDGLVEYVSIFWHEVDGTLLGNVPMVSADLLGASHTVSR